MRSIIILPLLTCFIFANDLIILNKDKKELREVQKKIINENYKSSKDEWISDINLSSSLTRSHSFSSQSEKLTKSASISISQSIYQSGGIEFSIQSAEDTLNKDLIAWENENIAILETINEILLDIKKLNLEIKQSDYELSNKDIELALNRIQYEAGNVDILDLNDAIMSKNSQYKSNISLINSLKDLEYELTKYTNLKYEEIDILDFKVIKKDKFIKNSLDLRYENSKVKVLDTSYKLLKSSYGPSVSLTSSLSYSNIDYFSTDTSSDSSSGSVGLKLSIPLFDITKKSELQKSKIELLKQKISIEDIKKELFYEYEQILSQIDTYEKQKNIIEENLKLYDDLIFINTTSNNAGMSSDYDLDILKNTRQINNYDLEINDINIQLEYAKLYFKTKATN